MPTPPILTPEQRAAALEKAAIARRVRAEVKDRLKMGILDLPGLFRETDANPILAKLKVVAAQHQKSQLSGLTIAPASPASLKRSD